jgi:hypothetical protein
VGSIVKPDKPKPPKIPKPVPLPPPPEPVLAERPLDPALSNARERTRRIARARFAGRSSTILTGAGGVSGGTTGGFVGSRRLLGG